MDKQEVVTELLDILDEHWRDRYEVLAYAVHNGLWLDGDPTKPDLNRAWELTHPA